ncbi:hypothetical protein ACQKE4_20665, partial [Halomonas sp. NPDC076908]
GHDKTECAVTIIQNRRSRSNGMGGHDRAEYASGGCRKVRWSVAGSGKRGGVRVIYFTKLANGEIWLLVIYKKAVKENIPAHILKSVREVLENE